jgi:hypothetical protein
MASLDGHLKKQYGVNNLVTSLEGSDAYILAISHHTSADFGTFLLPAKY